MRGSRCFYLAEDSFLDDQRKRDQAVTLIIEGDHMVLDPGKKETDKMYFKKVY